MLNHPVYNIKIKYNNIVKHSFRTVYTFGNKKFLMLKRITRGLLCIVYIYILYIELLKTVHINSLKIHYYYDVL